MKFKLKIMLWMVLEVSCLGIISCGQSVTNTTGDGFQPPIGQTISQILQTQKNFTVEFEDIEETFDNCALENIEEQDLDHDTPPAPSDNEPADDQFIDDDFSILFENSKVLITAYGETFYEGTWREVGNNLLEITLPEKSPFVVQVTQLQNNKIAFRLTKDLKNNACF